ncbi:13742_t:CDS:2 [Cetraspora pellucida]|uniref:13742_t:CDS:1 n=1 Tax=Cetraspora pellucida TaxID=1433469 RepID=A0A9N9GTT5_9GLOM|nr:13742_t:CDS:2 [Cetraspora pellucida]
MNTLLRKQELENLSAATHEVPQHKNFCQRIPRKNISHAMKKVTPPSPFRIAVGYTTIVIDTNCLIGDLNMVKKII